MTNTAEAELEGVIWAAMTAHKVTTAQPLEFIEAIKWAAMAYAAGDSDKLTELRRLVLHEAAAPERRDRLEIAGGAGRAPVAASRLVGSRARPPEGATLSTGRVIPVAAEVSVKSHPQGVDKS
jgi:hypothetical protein